MKFLSRTWPLPLLLALAATPLFGKSEVQVTCLDAAGNPINKVVVTLQAIQTNQLEQEKTNKKGIAKFKKIEDGIYRVYAYAEGYQRAYHEFLRLSGDARESVELTLNEGDSEKPLYFQDPTLTQRLNQLIVEGADAFRNGKMEEAEAKLKKALEIYPTSPDAAQNLAILYLQAGRFEEGEKTLEKTRELLKLYIEISPNSPQLPQLEQRLGEVEKLIASMPLQRIGAEADKALQSGDYPTAIAKYRQLVEQNPESAVLYYNLALAQAHGDKLADAKKNVAKALELQPGDAGFLRLRNQIEEIEKQGISLQAKEQLENIQGLLGKKEYAAALDKAEQAKDDVPEEFQGTLMLFKARAHAGLEQTDEAVGAYRKAAELAPEDYSPRNELANYLFEKERYQEGIGVYQESLKIQSKPLAQELFDLGQTFTRQGNPPAAAAAYEKAVEADPGFASAYYELGLYHYYDTKQMDNAKSMLEKFLEIGGEPAQEENARTVLKVIAKTKK